MISAIHLPVALRVIAFVAEDADRPGLPHQRRQLVEFLSCLRRLQVFGVDPVQHLEFPAARGQAALFRRAEPAQVKVGDAALVEARCELVLGKAGAAGSRHRAHVDQKLHAGLFEFVEHGLGRRLLIADGEERLILRPEALRAIAIFPAVPMSSASRLCQRPADCQ